MKRLLLLVVPAALFAGQARYARLGEFEGKVEYQPDAASEWRPAMRNAVLSDSAWIRTAAGARVEIELDDGGVLRLAGDALAELSDYTKLSTGQRVTVLSLDHGLAYFTGEAEGRDSLILAVPGAQATVRRGARVRLEAGGGSSQIAVVEGAIRFSSPTAELDVQEGRTLRVEPAQSARFFLYNEVAVRETDRWSEERDKALAAATSGAHAPGLRAGLADLDGGGTWIETADSGAVWKPKAAAGWAPFRNGKWTWYDALGFTWTSADNWGWLPYHYGRWLQHESAGWVWVPGQDAVFSPGDVYWLRGSGLVAWGPLAPGEQWKPPARPRQYLTANTTFAGFAADAREIAPAGFTAPKQPAVAFVAAPPSPALSAARLEAQRPVLQAGSTRVVPHVAGTTFEAPASVTEYNPPAVAVAEPAAPIYQPAPEPVLVPAPVQEPPTTVYYPVPVATGIVVINPPDRRDDRKHPREEAKPTITRPPVTVSAPRNETVRPFDGRSSPRREETQRVPAERTTPVTKPTAPVRPAAPAVSAPRNESRSEPASEEKAQPQVRRGNR